MKRPKLRVLWLAVAAIRFSWWYVISQFAHWRRAIAEDRVKGPQWYQDGSPVWRSNDVIEDETYQLNKKANQFAVDYWFNKRAVKA